MSDVDPADIEMRLLPGIDDNEEIQVQELLSPEREGMDARAASLGQDRTSLLFFDESGGALDSIVVTHQI